MHVPFEGHFSIGKCLILMKYDFPFFSFLGNFFLSCVRPLYQAQQPREFSPSFFFFFFFLVKISKSLNLPLNLCPIL